MRPRQRPAPAEVALVPEVLREYADPSATDGRGAGMDAFPDRDAWLAARREWEAAHGLTVMQWFGEVCDDALERGGLEWLGAAMTFYFCEGDDDHDPRFVDGYEPRLAVAGKDG